MKSNFKKAIKRNKYLIFLSLIVILGLILSCIFVGPAFINGSDNYEYVYMSYLFANGRFKELPADGVLETRYFLLSGIALFYKIFGFTPEASALFGVLCFLLTIVIIYFFGKELYNENAGILAAFLFSFLPLAINQASCVGDDIPNLFLSSLAILFLIKALKENKKEFFIISGFLSTITILASTAGGIIAAFSFLYLLLFSAFSKNIKRIGFYLLGVCFGILLILSLGWIITGDPFHVFVVILNWYPSPLKHGFSASPNFEYVVTSLFPYSFNLLDKPPKILTSIINLRFFDLCRLISEEGQFNLFCYFALASLVYLFVAKEKRAILPFGWFIFAFLYLSFGPTAISDKYLFIAYASRFNLVFAPAICLIIAISFANIFEKTKKSNKLIKFFVYLFSFASFFILFFLSVFEIYYISYSKYKITLPLLQVAEILKFLPENAKIYKGSAWIPLEVYLNFKRTFPILTENFTCNSFKDAEYIIIKKNEEIERNCNVTLIFQSSTPIYLQNFSFYEGIGIEYFYNLSIYKNKK
jgi:4-amino-4-deoxy-L-arabinose transferase-like glycosyltransferase